jgi:hypothetical protein
MHTGDDSFSMSSSRGHRDPTQNIAFGCLSSRISLVIRPEIFDLYDDIRSLSGNERRFPSVSVMELVFLRPSGAGQSGQVRSWDVSRSTLQSMSIVGTMAKNGPQWTTSSRQVFLGRHTPGSWHLSDHTELTKGFVAGSAQIASRGGLNIKAVPSSSL